MESCSTCGCGSLRVDSSLASLWRRVGWIGASSSGSVALFLDDPVILKHNIGCRVIFLQSVLAGAFRSRRKAQLKRKPWPARQRHCFVVPVVDLVNLALPTGCATSAGNEAPPTKRRRAITRNPAEADQAWLQPCLQNFEVSA
jgi:hypothetical protein